jgi:hypothetical protein
MTTTFAATHSQDTPRSTAVETVTYNENTGELVIDWHDDLYKYDGVSLDTYNALVAGTYKNSPAHASVGRSASKFKKDYGPGTYLGKFGQVKFVQATKASRVNTSGPTFPLSAQKSAPTVASTVSAASPTFSLTPSNVGSESKAKPAATYTVDYTVGTEHYEYTPSGVNSVDEAVKALADALAPLGLEGTAKGVYVEFE